MTDQATAPDGQWTRDVQWHDLAAAAIILGVIDSDDKASMFKLNALLERRMAEQQVRKHKTGPAQSASAFYSGRKR